MNKLLIALLAAVSLNAVADNPMNQQNVLNILQARVGYDPESGRSELLRTSLLRRTADDTDSVERVIVANAELLLIVQALADGARLASKKLW